jgi:hypothetical protein
MATGSTSHYLQSWICSITYSSGIFRITDENLFRIFIHLTSFHEGPDFIYHFIKPRDQALLHQPLYPRVVEGSFFRDLLAFLGREDKRWNLSIS